MTVCCYETAGYYTVRCMNWRMAVPLQQQERQLKQKHLIWAKAAHRSL